MNSSFSISPVFILLRIDPTEVIDKYNKGKMFNIAVPKINIQMSGGASLMKPIHGLVPTSETFSFPNRSGMDNIFLTTNHKSHTEARYNDTPMSNIDCDWCRIFCTHEMIGIPIHVTAKYSADGEMVPVYWTEGACCDFRCALAWIQATQRGSSFNNVSRYSSKHYLMTLYAINYPNGPDLVAAPDFRLLAPRGPMTPEQFKNRSYTLVRNGLFLTFSAKGIYQKISS